MDQKVQIPIMKSKFVALALTISFATAPGMTGAAGCPKGASKASIAGQRTVPEAMGGDAVEQRSARKRALEKKKFMQQNRPRWT
ncbi:hypothetical protein TPL01_08710 [Sulfuriferula plumbiphila]|uniref:Lipoprotein n=1 Tax=Sulfuriferula plumbiphila TaxID=171865 RepID=A0A512L5H2_9PROT|nr:hypothetical protein [Sulfuriferula plumbiphila]BBP03496.1 hypothetical protein SFPGR_09180 [Sulfuriferula plumbiphila]GEP29733.1 hypothetical protein TPL01_08710 [Sulfuriferula plumbiphila]